MTELREIMKHVEEIHHLLTILIAKSDDNEGSFDNDNNDSSSDDENLPHFSKQNSLLNDITPKSDKPKRSLFLSLIHICELSYPLNTRELKTFCLIRLCYAIGLVNHKYVSLCHIHKC